MTLPLLCQTYSSAIIHETRMVRDADMDAGFASAAAISVLTTLHKVRWSVKASTGNLTLHNPQSKISHASGGRVLKEKCLV